MSVSGQQKYIRNVITRKYVLNENCTPTWRKGEGNAVWTIELFYWHLQIPNMHFGILDLVFALDSWVK
jgi:hypothetical protein